MAKTKHGLHASLMCLATSGWCVNIWSEDKEFLRMIPIEGWNAEPETEAQALRALKDQAFVWGYTHINLLDDDGLETIREIALSVTPHRRERIKEAVKRSDFPTDDHEGWIRLHRLAFRLGVLPMWKMRTILQHPELAKAVTA